MAASRCPIRPRSRSAKVGRGRSPSPCRLTSASCREREFLEYDGFVTLTQTNGGDVLRVPFHVIPVARSAAGTTGNEDSHFTLRNRGLADSLVDIYQLGVRDPNEDLIHEGKGLPNDPDNWFDIRATGAHAFDVPGLGRILEFGIAT